MDIGKGTGVDLRAGTQSVPAPLVTQAPSQAYQQQPFQQQPQQQQQQPYQQQPYQQQQAQQPAQQQQQTLVRGQQLVQQHDTPAPLQNPAATNRTLQNQLQQNILPQQQAQQPMTADQWGNAFDAVKQQQPAQQNEANPFEQARSQSKEQEGNFATFKSSFDRDTDPETVRQAFNLGLTVDQTKGMFKVHSNNLLDMKADHDKSLNNELEISQKVLQGVWGKNYKQNLDAISNFVVKQIPVQKDAVAHGKTIRKNLSDVLRNPIVAQNMLSSALPNGYTPQVKGSPQQAGFQIPQQALSNDAQHQAVVKEWEGLMHRDSPLFSNDIGLRKQAMARKSVLGKYLFQADKKAAESRQQAAISRGEGMLSDLL